MANICKRTDGSWRARYRDDAGKEHARHFSRRVDAQAWLDSVTTAVHTGSYVDPASSRVKFGVWAQQWLSTKVNLKKTTYATYEYLLTKHVLPTWAEVRLVEITHEGVASWVAGPSRKGLSGSTVRQTHRVLSLALEQAVRDGRLPRNPATGVPIPRFLVDELATHVAAKAPSDFVFTAPEGGVLRNRNWRGGSFNKAVKRVGLTGLTPHGLRHTAASLAISSGAKVKVVQQMLGHASATMTLDFYGHLFHDQLDEVAEAMNAARLTARDKRTLVESGGNAPVFKLNTLRDAAQGLSHADPADAC